MKKSTFFLLLMMGIFFNGCNIVDKVFGDKKGVTCDSPGALSVLIGLVNKNSHREYKIDMKNIVVWDYNPVGRCTCKAKLVQVSDKNTGTDKQRDLSFLYGISDGGWIRYSTYITTANSQMYYVGLTPVGK